VVDVYETPIEPAAAAGSPEHTANYRAPILVAFPGPAKQRRLTVAFRFILAFPQAIALAFIGIAAAVVLVIGWFGALFMGRLPAFAADFLAGYLRWQTRYYAYMYLLTGAYPPFSFREDPRYPVQLAMRPGKLNRFAVLFRWVLAIWADIVETVVFYGLLPVLFIAWLIVLVTGAMPSALHQAVAAAVRYQVRVSGYLWMLTAEYPWGLFGDGSLAAAQAQAPVQEGSPAYPQSPTVPDSAGYGQPPEYGAQPGYEPPPGYGAQPEHGAPGYGPAEYGAQPEYGHVAGYGAPPSELGGYEPPLSAPGRPSWELLLSSGARQLVGLFVVLGLILVAATSAVSAVQATSTVSRAESIRHVETAHAALVRATAGFSATMSSCQTKADPLPCVTAADRAVAQAFGAFGQALRQTAMPSASSSAAASRISSAAAQLQRIFQELGSSSSLGQYQQTIQSSGLQQILNKFDADYSNLGAALNAR